jgi:hypothetical protein
MVTAVPIGTFKAEYAGEDLTVSKYATEHSTGSLPENDRSRIWKPFRRHDRRAVDGVFQRLSAPLLAFLREVTNESVSRPRSIPITAHHINAARGTSQDRDSIGNMAES